MAPPTIKAASAEKGMTVTSDEVRGFLRQMDDDDEFDDFELDAVALAAIAGGRGWTRGAAGSIASSGDRRNNLNGSVS